MKYWRVVEINKGSKPSSAYLSGAYPCKKDAEEHLARKRQSERSREFELLETEEDS